MGYNLKFTGQQIDNLLSKIEAMGENSTPSVDGGNSENIIKVYAPLPDMLWELGVEEWTLENWENISTELEAWSPEFKQTNVYTNIVESFSHNEQAYQDFINLTLENKMPLVIVDITPFGDFYGWLMGQSEPYYDNIKIAGIFPGCASLMYMKIKDEHGGESISEIMIQCQLDLNSFFNFSLHPDGSILDMNINPTVYIPEENVTLSDEQKQSNKKCTFTNYKNAIYYTVNTSNIWSEVYINPIESFQTSELINGSNVYYNIIRYFTGFDLKEIRITLDSGETTVSTIATLNAIEN